MEKWFTAEDAFPLYSCVDNMNKTTDAAASCWVAGFFSVMFLGRAESLAELNPKVTCEDTMYNRGIPGWS